MKKTVLILNGSPHGDKGNCGQFIKRLIKILKPFVAVRTVHLSKLKSSEALLPHLKSASGVLFVTGTYWDSWGSPMQKMFEELTPYEGSSLFLGKPCSVFVLMHSVGGKGILSRMQGVLSTLGFLIPPMSGMVLSLVSQLASQNKTSKHQKDFWDYDDLNAILGNLILAMDLKVSWQRWAVDGENFRKVWLR